MTARAIRIRERAALDARYARHALIAGWDQERLASLRVAVFGAGALGNEVLKNLALLGAGHVLIVDFDRVEPSNLARSVLFRAGDAGRWKAEVAAERVAGLNPALRVEAVCDDLHHAIGPGRIESFDLAIACVDSVGARLGIDALCRRAGVPWWNGGLGADACELTRFDPREGPCYACTLSERALAREARRWSCQDGRALADAPRAVPTTATAASAGAALLVHDALAAMMPQRGAETLAPGARLLLETLPYRLTRFDVARNPRCANHEGEPPALRLALDRDATGRAMLEAAGADPDATEIHLGFDLVLAWRCGCAAPRAPLVPARRMGTRCAGCGEPPRELETAASLRGSHPAFDLPLRRLGFGDGAELTLYGDAGLRCVRLANEPRTADDLMPRPGVPT